MHNPTSPRLPGVPVLRLDATGAEYSRWRRSLKFALEAKGTWKHCNGEATMPMPDAGSRETASTTQPSLLEERRAWVRQDREVKLDIYLCLTEEVMLEVFEVGPPLPPSHLSALEIVESLDEHFTSFKFEDYHHAFCHFLNLHIDQYATIIEFNYEFWTTLEDLVDHGHPLSNTQACSAYFSKLRCTQNPWVAKMLQQWDLQSGEPQLLELMRESLRWNAIRPISYYSSHNQIAASIPDETYCSDSARSSLEAAVKNPYTSVTSSPTPYHLSNTLEDATISIGLCLTDSTPSFPDPDSPTIPNDPPPHSPPTPIHHLPANPPNPRLETRLPTLQTTPHLPESLRSKSASPRLPSTSVGYTVFPHSSHDAGACDTSLPDTMASSTTPPMLKRVVSLKTMPSQLKGPLGRAPPPLSEHPAFRTGAGVSGGEDAVDDTGGRFARDSCAMLTPGPVSAGLSTPVEGDDGASMSSSSSSSTSTSSSSYPKHPQPRITNPLQRRHSSCTDISSTKQPTPILLQHQHPPPPSPTSTPTTTTPYLPVSTWSANSSTLSLPLQGTPTPEPMTALPRIPAAPKWKTFGGTEGGGTVAMAMALARKKEKEKAREREKEREEVQGKSKKMGLQGGAVKASEVQRKRAWSMGMKFSRFSHSRGVREMI
ncbi:predicted protein [Plenodomus lingam JN3]|uniref:Predicted protein n=1 Tax=Leptosphaeria maculans (strain JN3 / isolate v23.1.3 / race Av1-4-5-6-7-8) TaxID=985895 RepID=E4ZH88_LEPMJ|nr:predicted protein [Plenodomus lingam JN3]CBX90658.1 predicted protein [Plenodomus lingam JN3]